MDQDVHRRIRLPDASENSLNLLVVSDVALERLGAGQLGGESFGVTLQTLRLVADGERGARFRELLADGPGDAAFVGQAEDDRDFALQINHACLELLRFVVQDSSLRQKKVVLLAGKGNDRKSKLAEEG